MKLKKNIFDRLSLKKKISINRQNKLSDQLFLESKKNTQLIEQIKDLQNNRKNDDTGLRSAYLLKSQNWYSQKLTEELDQKVTKQSFIEKELKGLQKKIAIEHQNMTKAVKKADETRKKEAASLEAKRELMIPKINKL
jgi:uncharacterized coiled-coil DUF342 family protein